MKTTRSDFDNHDDAQELRNYRDDIRAQDEDARMAWREILWRENAQKYGSDVGYDPYWNLG